jgi:glycosyltransferase involved in cell wall biosynthesis
MSEVARRDPRIRLLLVGEGPLRPAIERQITDLGLADRVLLVGHRRDVPRLMLGAMDALLFPSLFEGLGLVLIEAQAAGLACLIADNVPEEADLVPPLIHRWPLSKSAASWARALLAIMNAERRVAQPDALRLVERSAFNIRTEVSELETLYCAGVQPAV